MTDTHIMDKLPEGFDSKSPEEKLQVLTEGSNPEPSSQVSQPEQTRPEGLPEKFNSVEDLIASHKELEARFTKDSQEKAESVSDVQASDESQVVEKAGLDMNELTEVFNSEGQFKPEHYEAFEKVGIPKELVDSHMQMKLQLVQQTAEKSDAILVDKLGGQGKFDAMKAWALSTLSDAELSAFDADITSNNEVKKEMAVMGLQARFLQANPEEPKLLHGSPANISNNDVFNSPEEVQKAMSDPRYITDTFYQKEVQDKLRASIF